MSIEPACEFISNLAKYYQTEVTALVLTEFGQFYNSFKTFSEISQRSSSFEVNLRPFGVVLKR